MLYFNFPFAIFTFSIYSVCYSSVVHPRLGHHYRRAIDQTVLLGNGKAAQTLNAKFSGMTTDAACQTGDNACIAGGFYQCVSGKYVGGPCAQGLKCFAMHTEADATARIADTGATGGLTGGNASSSSSTSNSTEASPDSQSPGNSTGTTSDSSDASGPSTDGTHSENRDSTPDMTVTGSGSRVTTDRSATPDKVGESTPSNSTSSDGMNSKSRVKDGDEVKKVKKAGSPKDKSEVECQEEDGDEDDNKLTN